MAKNRKQRKSPVTIAIIGEGHTEKIYFEDYKNTVRPKGLKIFPRLPGRRGDEIGILNKAISLKNEGFNFAIALIDMDVIKTLKKKEKYLSVKKKAIKEGVIVYENNPCFEVWFLIHFMKTGRVFKNCKEVVKLLDHPERLLGYSKNRQKQKKNRLYNMLRDKMESDGIPNAKYLESRLEDGGSTRAEVFKMFADFGEEKKLLNC